MPPEVIEDVDNDIWYIPQTPNLNSLIMKARPADYLNCILERDLEQINQSPGRLRNTDHSLSFSLTQKDSNFKYLPDMMESQRRSSSKNKEN